MVSAIIKIVRTIKKLLLTHRLAQQAWAKSTTDLEAIENLFEILKDIVAEQCYKRTARDGSKTHEYQKSNSLYHKTSSLEQTQDNADLMVLPCLIFSTGAAQNREVLCAELEN